MKERYFADFLVKQLELSHYELNQQLGWSRQKYYYFKRTKSPRISTLKAIRAKLRLQEIEMAKILGKYHLQL